MRSFLITLILLFGFVTSTNCDENKENLKMVTKDFTMHFIKEYSPHIDIYVPKVFKKINLPEQFSFSDVDEMHYSTASGNTLTLDPLKPLDELKFEFGQDKNSITYDDDGNVKFMFRKSFNWKKRR
jgi:hypothetical protein